MKRRCSRLLAAAAALALSVQSTGAASLPAALLMPQAAFPPPGARFAAFPAPRAAAPRKAAEGASWLDSARIVSAFVLERLREEPSSAPREESAPPAPEAERPTPAAAPVSVEAPATAPNPGAGSPADRMLIVMDPGRSIETVLRSRGEDFSAPPAVAEPIRLMPPVLGRRLEHDGLSARVSYLGAHGLLKVGGGVFTAAFADGITRRTAATGLPEDYRQDFPIYFHGEEVEIELTVENRTGRTLRGVRLSAVEETYRPSGAAGQALVPPVDKLLAEALAPGERATVRWHARLEGPNRSPVNFEQTHVRVTAEGLTAPLLDVPQAGVVDPPGPGML